MGTISDISVANVVNGSQVDATVTWSTDIQADSKVSFGKGAPGSPILGVLRDGSQSTSHALVLGGLDPDSDYFAVVASSDGFGTPLGYAAGNGSVSFHTPSAGPIVEPGPPPTVGAPSSDSVQISWATAAPGLGMVVYRRDGDSQDLQEAEESSGTAHQVTLSDLASGTKYRCHYETDLDDSDVTIVSADFEFSTADAPGNDEAPGRVGICASPAVVQVGSASTITVQVIKRHGEPQAGIPVQFTLGNGKAEGSLSVGSAVTDAQGRCSTVFTVTGIPGQRRKAHRRVKAQVGAAGGKQKHKGTRVIGRR